MKQGKTTSRSEKIAWLMENTHLWGHIVSQADTSGNRALAKTMKMAGLYAPSTSLGDIQTWSLIREAKGEHAPAVKAGTHVYVLHRQVDDGGPAYRDFLGVYETEEKAKFAARVDIESYEYRSENGHRPAPNQLVVAPAGTSTEWHIDREVLQ